MRYYLILMAAIVFACHPRKEVSNVPIATSITSPVVDFDSLKAAKYGADAYGMKKYVMAFLKKGPNPHYSSEIYSKK